jgi:adenosylmethionine-8-amino-7-oxononanoate aminotransferase
MGRLGAILASHLADGAAPISTAALPDFVALSKGLTGGVLPLSAVLTTDAVYDLFDADYTEGRAFLHSNTYTGNALGVAVANAVLDVFAADDLLGRVAALGPRLRASLESVAAARPYLCNLRACGMVAAVDVRATDGSARDPARRTGYAIYREAVRRGALLRPIGDTMYLFPPLTVTPAEIDQMAAILGDSLDAVVR